MKPYKNTYLMVIRRNRILLQFVKHLGNTDRCFMIKMLGLRSKERTLENA